MKANWQSSMHFFGLYFFLWILEAGVSACAAVRIVGSIISYEHLISEILVCIYIYI